MAIPFLIPLILAGLGAGAGALANREDRGGGALKGALMGGGLGLGGGMAATTATGMFGRMMNHGQQPQGGGAVHANLGQTIGQGTPQTAIPQRDPRGPNTIGQNFQNFRKDPLSALSDVGFGDRGALGFLMKNSLGGRALGGLMGGARPQEQAAPSLGVQGLEGQPFPFFQRAMGLNRGGGMGGRF